MEAVNALIAAFNTAVGTSIIIMLALNCRMVKFPVTHKLGLWIAGAGLVYQALDFVLLGDRYHVELMVLPALSYAMIMASMFCTAMRRRSSL